MTSPAPTYENNLIMVAQRLTHDALGRDMLITYGCNNDASSTAYQALADGFQTAFATAWVAQLDTNLLIQEATCLFGLGTTTPAMAISSGVAQSGSRVLSSAPPNNNMLIQKRTALAGRKNRGRVYLPYSFDETGVDEAGILSGGEVSGAQARANAWLTALDTNDVPMVIVNRVLSLNPTPPPTQYVSSYLAGQPVTQLIVQALIGSQRRRIGR
jgi:hypothetical protein